MSVPTLPAPPLSPRGRTVVLLTCCLSVFVAGLDVTVVNVALPSIQRALNTPVSGLQWAIDAYTLVIACLLMFSGSLADRFGRRRVFQTGLAIFSLGSLLCSIAPNLAAMVAFRALQAVGGSSHAAWAVLAGCGGATVLLGLVSTGRWARAQAERSGRQLTEPVMEDAVR
jgi:MFS family permease